MGTRSRMARDVVTGRKSRPVMRRECWLRFRSGLLLPPTLLVLSSWATPATPALGESTSTLHGSGERDVAGQVRTESLAKEPRNAEALFSLGRMELEAGKFDSAITRLEVITTLQPDRSIYWQWLGRAYGMRARAVGVLSQLQLVGKVRAAFERAVALDPDNLLARDDLANFYAEAPGFLGGSVAKARAQATEITRRDPYLGALADGEISQAQKDYPAAARAYELASTLAPERADAHGHLAETFGQAGEYAKGFAAADRLLARRADEPLGLYYLGEIGALSGQRLPEAEAALRRYLQTPHDLDQPSAADARLRLGQIEEKRGNLAAARADYTLALRLDPAGKRAQCALRQLGSAPGK